MNNKIKLLAEQAGLKVPDDAEYNSHVYRYALERFANSIVRECAQVANDHNEEAEGVHLGVGSAIKEYFGVK